MWCSAVKKKKDSPTFKKNLLISCSPTNSERNTAFTLNQTNIASQSEVVVLKNTRREIVSRATALIIGEEA